MLEMSMWQNSLVVAPAVVEWDFFQNPLPFHGPVHLHHPNKLLRPSPFDEV